MRENDEIVIPRLRPLRYDDNRGGVPEEKGVDVQLALAVVEHVLLGRCDVAVLFSNDTDLTPAVEAVCRLKGSRSIETAAWKSRGYEIRPRPIKGVVHHGLSGTVFESVERAINYAYQGDSQ